jgi:alpha,alpha-trehalase
LSEAVPLLEREYKYWELHNVNVNGHALTRYFVDYHSPRPESYREDYELGKDLSPEDARRLYGNIAAGAESGWDFSSRWFLGGYDMHHIKTNDIIPVDLNAFLYQMETNIANFFKILNNDERSNYYLMKSEQRKTAIMKILWNQELLQWFDYDLINNMQRIMEFPSNFFPIWTGSYDSKVITNEVKDEITKNLHQLVRAGGFLTSLTHTNQQWDYPNAWPPLQDILISGLENLGTDLSKRTATTLALSWINSNFLGWCQNHTMFEKYNALIPGQRGDGGEYEPQEGFGWSNGVLLSLITRYAHII